MYKQHVDKLEPNQVYVLHKVKKTMIKTDTGIRMATTNVTKVHEATPDQIDVFSDVKFADKKIHGVCLMFNDFSYYRSCKKHLTKIDEDGKCLNCGDIKKEDSKLDFRCNLMIEHSKESDDEKDNVSQDNANEDDDNEDDDNKDDDNKEDVGQDDDSIISVVVFMFMRHLGIQAINNDDEEKIIDILDNSIVGKMVEIHYNVVGEDNNVAVKVSFK